MREGEGRKPGDGKVKLGELRMETWERVLNTRWPAEQPQKEEKGREKIMTNIIWGKSE